MNRLRFFRGLRISVSAMFVVLGLLFIVLCVRSYLGRDYLGGYIAPANRYEIHSINGTLIFLQRERVFISYELFMNYPEWLFSKPSSLRRSGFGYHSDGSFTAIFVSYWLLTVASIAAAAAPWGRYRFSVRALLLATTFVAILLGASLWLRR